MKPSDVLLIGGAGFLGSVLSRSLSADGWNVGILDRNPGQERREGVTDFFGDLRDLPLLRRALGRYSNVVYLAHEARTAPAADRLPANFTSNLELFLTVLEEAVECGLESFSLISSGGAVYGNPTFLPIPETHPTQPESPYGVCKIAMENYLAMTARQKGFRHLCLRPSNPYGPGQRFDGVQGLVAIAMARMARKKTIKLYGGGLSVKDYMFAPDLVDAVSLLLKNLDCSGAYNIGSGTGVSVCELVSKIGAVIGTDAITETADPLPGDVQANILDITKIQKDTGWAPKVALDEGLQKTWEWMKPQLRGHPQVP